MVPGEKTIAGRPAAARLQGWTAALLLAATALAGAQQPAEGSETAEEGTTTFHGSTEVVASRLATDPAAAGRREVVVTRQELEALPAQTLQDALALLPGVGLARRGARGVQGDLNLRGATFEQVVVLVDGLRVNNPQTGHHHLDLFLPVAAIDRIEVLYGPGSAVHGPDAFGGAINIVTGPPPLQATVRAGENGLAAGAVAGEPIAGLWGAAEREVHTGFRDNTEADVNQAAAGWSWRRGDTRVQVTAAAGRRRFGAHAFYSSRFPDEREATEGELAVLQVTTPLLGHELRLGARASSHRDDFVLDRERPEFFRNRHRTRGVVLDLALAGSVGRLDWLVGTEVVRDDIRSSNLGVHHRTRSSLFAEVGRFSGRHTGGLQVRVDRQDPWGTELTSGLGGAVALGRGWRGRAHLGTSFRAPSFTDLYYRSPSTVGDPDLEPERGRSVEIGADRGSLSATVFLRRSRDVIDYLLGNDDVWRADNLGRITTTGAEVAAALPVRGAMRWQRLGLVWLDSDLDVDPERSAYALAHPRLELTWTGALGLGRDGSLGWSARFRDPTDRGSWAVLDLRLGRRILDDVTVSLQASNVLDRERSELHGVPLPGRWLSLELTWRREAP